MVSRVDDGVWCHADERFVGLFATAILAAPSPSVAQSAGTTMPMVEGPTHFEPVRQSYTTNHLFLIRRLAIPAPIPYERYFDLRLAVYGGRSPNRRLTGADIGLAAGMRHGLEHGFADGMQSSPKIEKQDGVFRVSGTYFHMMGHWVLEVTVHARGKEGIAHLRLPCCGR